MRSKVYVTRRIFDEAIVFLAGHVEVVGKATDRVLDPGELRDTIPAMDGLLCLLTDRIDAPLMDFCLNLRVVANFGVGYNNIDLSAATERGILVTNTPGVLTETTADFAWCLLMAAARRVAEADRYVRAGKFKAWEPQTLLGHDFHGKVLGLIGLGRIGQALARRATGFEMEVLFFDPQAIPEAVGSKLGVRNASLEEVFRNADFISLHVPLVEGTRDLLNDDAFRLMKPNCIVVNTSRGPVIDEKALIRALQVGAIAGAGLDVYEREPEIDQAHLEMENVVLAPHIASASRETRSGCV